MGDTVRVPWSSVHYRNVCGDGGHAMASISRKLSFIGWALVSNLSDQCHYSLLCISQSTVLALALDWTASDSLTG